MKRLAVILVGLCCAISSVAWAKHGMRVPLAKVQMGLAAQTWVTSDTANVVVNVDAVLNKASLATIQQHIQQNLLRIIPKVSWHITNYERSQDQSGLEKLQAIAEARVPTAALMGLREKARTVSKPGEKYRIQRIAFTPSFADVQKARQALRETLYQHAAAELARLNKQFPKAHYQLLRLNFLPGVRMNASARKLRVPGAMVMAEVVRPAVGIQTNNRLRMQARFVAVSPQLMLAVKKSMSKKEDD